MASDPRQINDWFVGAIDVYGERLRRICRFLKAWRDHNQPHLDRVSSILLMVCAWRVFDDFGRPNVPERDDAALLLVARRLPVLLAGPVENPTAPEEKVDARLGSDRRVAIAMAEGREKELGEIVEKCFDPAGARGDAPEGPVRRPHSRSPRSHRRDEGRLR